MAQGEAKEREGSARKRRRGAPFSSPRLARAQRSAQRSVALGFQGLTSLLLALVSPPLPSSPSISSSHIRVWGLISLGTPWNAAIAPSSWPIPPRIQNSIPASLNLRNLAQKSQAADAMASIHNSSSRPRPVAPHQTQKGEAKTQAQLRRMLKPSLRTSPSLCTYVHPSFAYPPPCSCNGPHAS